MAIDPQLTGQAISARIERLPPSPWHVRMRVIIGTATFFDAFDSIAIATVLPALVSHWHLTPQQIGGLISVGFAGQAVGAVSIGYLAERWGRIPAMTLSIAIYAVMSVCCALVGSYELLVVCRLIQGFGLGGEVPIAAAYINEIARAKERGRFFLVYECVFLLGLVVCAAVGAYVVPRFGYQWMFAIGGVPALLVLVLRRACPESPRWLASRGRIVEADRVLSGIERQVERDVPLPPVADTVPPAVPQRPTRWTELFQGQYLKRTLVVWVMWFCSYLVVYGLVTWLPTIYRTVYHVSVQKALVYGISASLCGLIGGLFCAFLIDRVGRRPWLLGAFILASIPLLGLCWWAGAPLESVVVLASLGNAAMTTITIVLYLYTPEIYPTRMRALGTSWATFWPRFSSVIGASVIGWLLPNHGIQGVFLLFAIVSALGAFVCWLGVIETGGKTLEEISP